MKNKIVKTFLLLLCGSMLTNPINVFASNDTNTINKDATPVYNGPTYTTHEVNGVEYVTKDPDRKVPEVPELMPDVSETETPSVTIGEKKYTLSDITDDKAITKAEKGVSDYTEGKATKELNTIYDLKNNGIEYEESGYENKQVTGQKVIQTVKGNDGNSYAICEKDGLFFLASVREKPMPDGSKTIEYYGVNYSSIESNLPQNSIDTAIQTKEKEVVTESLKNNNYLHDGWLWTEGLIKECRENYVSGKKAKSSNCKAYETLVESSAAHELGVGITEQLQKLYNVDAEFLTSAELQAKIDEIMQNRDAVSAETLAELERLSTLIAEKEEEEIEEAEEIEEENPDVMTDEPITGEYDPDTQPIPSSVIAENPSAAIPEAEIPTITPEESGVLPGVTEQLQEEALLTPTPTPEISKEVLECKENEIVINNVCVDPYNEAANELLATYKDTMSSIDKDFFGEDYEPIALEVDGLKGNLYVKTNIDLMSEDDDYFSSLTQNEDGTFSRSETSVTNGSTAVYSYGYDINGEIISDVVIASQQYGYLEIFDDAGLVTSNVIKIFGQGNREAYAAYGYGEVKFGQKDYGFVLDASYIDNGEHNKESKTSVNIVSTVDNVPIPNAISGLVKKAVLTMEQYNDESFNVSLTDIIETKDNENGLGVKVVLFDNNDDRTIIVAEDGIKVTYKFSMNQIVSLSNGATYALEDVMKYNMLPLETLIKAGFEVTRNDKVVTVDTIGQLTYKVLLDKSLSSSNNEKKEEKLGVKINENKSLTSLGDWLTEEKVEELKDYNPEYVWSEGNIDYYLPTGVNKELELKFYDKETEKYETISISNALAQGYISAEDLMAEFEKQGITVVKAENTTTKASFKVVAKIDKDNFTKEITKFFEDGQYTYSFEYKEMADNVNIIAANGIKYTLDYALNHNLYTIDEITTQIDKQNANNTDGTAIIYFRTTKELQIVDDGQTGGNLPTEDEKSKGKEIEVLDGTKGVEYAEGKELYCLVDSQEEAEEIAKQYGIEFVSFFSGVADFHTTENPYDVVQRGKEKGYKELSVNVATKLDDPIENPSGGNYIRETDVSHEIAKGGKEIVDLETTKGVEIAEGKELICLADSQEEAETIAKQYGIELVSFYSGVADFHTTENPYDVIERGKKNGYKELSINAVIRLSDPIASPRKINLLSE